MKIELDDETIDSIVCATLKSHIKYCKDNIKSLRKTPDLKDYQKEDLSNNIETLAALEVAYNYFGGNL